VKKKQNNKYTSVKRIVPSVDLFYPSGTFYVIIKGRKENSSNSSGTIVKLPKERSVSNAVILF
jgi:hypothetical protein